MEFRSFSEWQGKLFYKNILRVFFYFIFFFKCLLFIVLFHTAHVVSTVGTGCNWTAPFVLKMDRWLDNLFLHSFFPSLFPVKLFDLSLPDREILIKNISFFLSFFFLSFFFLSFSLFNFSSCGYKRLY